MKHQWRQHLWSHDNLHLAFTARLVGLNSGDLLCPCKSLAHLAEANGMLRLQPHGQSRRTPWVTRRISSGFQWTHASPVGDQYASHDTRHGASCGTDRSSCSRDRSHRAHDQRDGKGRSEGLNPHARSAAEACKLDASARMVVPLQGRQQPHSRQKSVTNTLSTLMERAGAPGSAHSLRHWSGTNPVGSGADYGLCKI